MLRSCKAVKTDEYNKNSEMATSSQETLQYKGIEVQTYILHHKGTQEIFNIYYCLQMKLWEGNVFRGVCLSTGEVSVCPEGSLSREGVSVQGGNLYPGRWSLSRRPHMVVCGQYASYWNAFFFQLDLNITHSNSL